MTVKSGVNWRNWKKLLEFLKTRKPSEIQMHTELNWPRSLEPTKTQLIHKHCGTGGCIAGWGGILFGDPKDMRMIRVWPDKITQGALRLDDLELFHLYYGCWRTETQTLYSVKKRDVIRYMTKALKEKNVMVKL